MNKLDLENLEFDAGKIIIIDTKDGIQLNLVGTFDDDSPERFLEPFFDSLHRKVLNAGLKKVLVNCEEMDFLNSINYRSFY